MRFYRCRPGFALLPMLLLSVVCMLAALTVAALSSFFLNAAQMSSANDRALALAEGAISLCMSRLHQSIQPGAQPFGAPTDSVTFTPDPSDATDAGVLTFDTTCTWGYSTNNVKSNSYATGWGACNVAGGTAHLMAQGTYRGATTIVECTVAMPQYNYALSTDGALSIASGNLVVSGVRTLAAASMTPSPPVGANVGSNTSINVSGGSTSVSGDVVCKTTSVNLGSPAWVGGVVTQAPVSLPTVNIAGLGTTISAAAGAPLPATMPAGYLNGDNYAPDGLHVTGNLQLNGGLLYVQGPVQVDGSLTGTGAIIVQGTITVNQASNLDCVNELALVSSDSVTLGQQSVGNPSTQFFQGLVYSQGLLATNNVTVVGAMVGANPTHHAGTGVQLYDSPVIYAPFATNLQLMSLSAADLLSAGALPLQTLGTGMEAAPGVDGGQPGISGSSLGDASGGTGWVPGNVAPFNGPMTVVVQQIQSQMGTDPNLPLLSNLLMDTALGNPAVPTSTPNIPPGPVGLIAGQNYPNASPTPITAGSGMNVLGGGVATANGMSINNLVFPASGTPSYTVEYAPGMSLPWAELMVFTVEYNPTTGQMQSLPAPVIYLDGLWDPTAYDIGQFNNFLSTYYPNYPNANYASLVASMENAQQIFMTTANQLLAKAPPAPANPDISLALNTFLSDQTPLQIIAWRQLMPGAPHNRSNQDD